MLKEFFQFKFLTLGTGTRKYIEKLKKKKSFWLGFRRSNGKCSSELYSKPSQKDRVFPKIFAKKFRFRYLNGF